MGDPIDIHGLVSAAAIEDISFLELSAVRANTSSKNTPNGDFDVEPILSLQMGRNENGHNFRIRIRIEIDAQPGKVLVDGAVEYVVDGIDLSQVPDPVLLEFSNRVGVFALIPYLRQATADITQRVFGTPLVMPIYRQGDIDFGPDDDGVVE